MMNALTLLVGNRLLPVAAAPLTIRTSALSILMMTIIIFVVQINDPFALVSVLVFVIENHLEEEYMLYGS